MTVSLEVSRRRGEDADLLSYCRGGSTRGPGGHELELCESGLIEDSSKGVLKGLQVGERNFEGFADDVNEEIPQVKVKVHPADHTGPEFDAGGWLNDMLRKPDAVGDPLERDRLINIPPTKMVEAQEPNSNVPLELGDSVVDASEANDDPALQDLGIPYSKEEVSKPQGEENYKYGLLADFQDRDVKVQPIVAASQAVAQVWEREEEEASEKSKIEGTRSDPSLSSFRLVRLSSFIQARCHQSSLVFNVVSVTGRHGASLPRPPGLNLEDAGAGTGGPASH
eukprot:762704-Hanusia_phi.AAC.3